MTVAVTDASLTLTEVGLGTATVSVTADDGNGGSVTDEFVVTVIGRPPIVTVIGRPLTVSDKKFTIYPNPTDGKITISRTSNATLINITDIGGKKVRYQTLENNSDGMTLDLSGLDEGVYFLNLNENGKLKSYKISKNN